MGENDSASVLQARINYYKFEMREPFVLFHFWKCGISLLKIPNYFLQYF